jgi:hypothetical protein
MELAYGRAIFDTYGEYAADPDAIVTMLECAVRDMRARAAQLAGKQRDHTPVGAGEKSPGVLDQLPQPGGVIISARSVGAGPFRAGEGGRLEG